MTRLQIIRDFFVKGHFVQQQHNKTYTSCVIQLDLAISPESICYYDITRFQSGEVNSIRYADVVRIYPEDEGCITAGNSIFFITDCLGYGKSVRPVTYYMSVTVVYKDAQQGRTKSISSGTICAKTLDGKRINDIYEEV